MNGTALMLDAVHGAETRLADGFETVAERHRHEPEIRHVATDLAGWSRDHAARLTEAARDRGLSELAAPGTGFGHSAVLLRETSDEALGYRPGLLLLRDLLDLHAAAGANSLYWDMLTALAKATKDEGLLDLANSCHPRTRRQVAWARSMIEVLSPQALASAPEARSH
ncbi:hypothetical protein [Catenulispora subtropica]|uniref:Uncharacterized protein n=1 Tax=Catenulispora subtropica TaxID=450798 RepID=A0ABN2SHE7_9ACTN